MPHLITAFSENEFLFLFGNRLPRDSSFPDVTVLFIYLFIKGEEYRSTEKPDFQGGIGQPCWAHGYTWERGVSFARDCFFGSGGREAELTSSTACTWFCHHDPTAVVSWCFEADLHLSDGMWCKYAVISVIQTYHRCSLKIPVCHSEELVIISSHTFQLEHRSLLIKLASVFSFCDQHDH